MSRKAKICINKECINSINGNVYFTSEVSCNECGADLVPKVTAVKKIFAIVFFFSIAIFFSIFLFYIIDIPEPPESCISSTMPPAVSHRYYEKTLKYGYCPLKQNSHIPRDFYYKPIFKEKNKNIYFFHKSDRCYLFDYMKKNENNSIKLHLTSIGKNLIFIKFCEEKINNLEKYTKKLGMERVKIDEIYCQKQNADHMIEFFVDDNLNWEGC